MWPPSIEIYLTDLGASNFIASIVAPRVESPTITFTFSPKKGS